MTDLTKIEGFEWDKGNNEKNWKKHSVSNEECEEGFVNTPIYFFPDSKHSFYENRLGLFGKTKKGRLLTIIFTLRKNRIRVISARDQNRKEKRFYQKYEKETLQKTPKI